MNCVETGSIPGEGSSKRIIGGFPKSAVATDAFLLFPHERDLIAYLYPGLSQNRADIKKLLTRTFEMA